MRGCESFDPGMWFYMIFDGFWAAWCLEGVPGAYLGRTWGVPRHTSANLKPSTAAQGSGGSAAACLGRTAAHLGELEALNGCPRIWWLSGRHLGGGVCSNTPTAGGVGGFQRLCLMPPAPEKRNVKKISRIKKSRFRFAD